MPRGGHNRMPTGVKRRYFGLIRAGWSGSEAAQKVGVSLSYRLTHPEAERDGAHLAVGTGLWGSWPSSTACPRAVDRMERFHCAVRPATRVSFRQVDNASRTARMTSGRSRSVRAGCVGRSLVCVRRNRPIRRVGPARDGCTDAPYEVLHDKTRDFVPQPCCAVDAGGG